MEIVKCNWAAICRDSGCPHFYPHESRLIPHRNKQPQCEDKGTYCYAADKLVNCVSVLGIIHNDMPQLVEHMFKRVSEAETGGA